MGKILYGYFHGASKVFKWYLIGFLAAMSSSRSDVVTKSVCVSVCVCVVILLSLKLLKYFKLDVSKVLRGYSKGVLKMFQRCCKKVSGVY